MIKHVISLLRPAQWAKNSFIFLPLFFSGNLLNIHFLLFCGVAFAAFSMAASAVYCFNDINDLQADKKHPRKCLRPLASGKVTKLKACEVMVICLVLAFGLLFFFGGPRRFSIMLLLAFYCLLNAAYTFKLKQYMIVDVFVIAICFVLRIVVGGVITGIWLSEWILIMTFLLALFLAFAKRRDDVVLYRKTGVLLRKYISRYSLEFINQVLTIIAAVSMVAYIMYTLSPEVISRFNCRYIYVTAVFVLSGIIRYLQLTIVDTHSGSPTEILIHDKFIQICILGWITSFFILIYLI